MTLPRPPICGINRVSIRASFDRNSARHVKIAQSARDDTHALENAGCPGCERGEISDSEFSIMRFPPRNPDADGLCFRLGDIPRTCPGRGRSQFQDREQAGVLQAGRPSTRSVLRAATGGRSRRRGLRWTITRMMQQHCSLEKFGSAFGPLVRAHEMPPAKQPQPTQAETQIIIAWIDSVTSADTCIGQKDPGRVTLRRLNRGVQQYHSRPRRRRVSAGGRFPCGRRRLRVR